MSKNGRVWAEQTEKGRAKVLSRRKLPQFHENGNGNNDGRGQVVVLHRIVTNWKRNHDNKPERVVEKGNPSAKDYTVVGKYLYRDKYGEKIIFNLSLLIPEDMEIEKVPAHEGGNLKHFRIQFGDILVFIYNEESPKPGDYINGLAEIEISESMRPNMGPKTRLYPAINLSVGYGEKLPRFSAEFNSTKRKLVPKGATDTSPTYGKMIIHIDPIPGLS